MYTHSQLFKLAMSIYCMVSFLFCILLSQNHPQSDEQIIYKRKTVITFGGDTIEGERAFPLTEFINVRKYRKFKSLLKVRNDFDEKVLRSVHQL